MKTIMIVDDSLTMLISLEGVLSKAGFKVEKAKNGEEALQKLQSGLQPDAVISDYHMPGINGAELVGNIRKMPGFRFKPIFMLTTESHQTKREEAKAVGATAWLVKPVPPDALIGALRKVIPGA